MQTARTWPGLVMATLSDEPRVPNLSSKTIGDTSQISILIFSSHNGGHMSPICHSALPHRLAEERSYELASLSQLEPPRSSFEAHC